MPRAEPIRRRRIAEGLPPRRTRRANAQALTIAMRSDVQRGSADPVGHRQNAIWPAASERGGRRVLRSVKTRQIRGNKPDKHTLRVEESDFHEQRGVKIAYAQKISHISSL